MKPRSLKQSLPKQKKGVALNKFSLLNEPGKVKPASKGGCEDKITLNVGPRRQLDLSSCEMSILFLLTFQSALSHCCFASCI